jgi:hypothetical protein
VEGVEAEIDDVAHQLLQSLDNVEQIDAERREHDADHDR